MNNDTNESPGSDEAVMYEAEKEIGEQPALNTHVGFPQTVKRGQLPAPDFR